MLQPKGALNSSEQVSTKSAILLSEPSRGPDRVKANNVLEILKARLFAPQPRIGTPADRGKILQFESRNAEQKPQQGLPARIIPGIIAGSADLDPAAVMTATVAGASFGVSVAWIVLLCIPILSAVFGVSARIGHA